MKKDADKVTLPSAAEGIELQDTPMALPSRVITKDTAELPITEEADKAREESYDALYQWERLNRKGEWETYTLEPYSDSREDIVEALSSHDLVIPAGIKFKEVATLRPWAVKLLFVCSHTAEALLPLRGDPIAFLRAVDEWADVNVPRIKKTKAVDLALKIHNAQYPHLAVPKPSTGSTDSGN